MPVNRQKRVRVSETMRATARHLRARMTPAERRLWEHLRGRRLAGLKFRRQHPFAWCIVDFYCPACRLVVEVDGAIHDWQREADAVRDARLAAEGKKVFRLHNGELFGALDDALERIVQAAFLRK